MVTVEQVREQLLDVYDPELMMDIVNLGLVYDIEIEDEGRSVTIVMTLTTMGCPAFGGLQQEIVSLVGTMPGVEKVNVQLTFDPPWNKEMMSEEAKTVFKYLF